MRSGRESKPSWPKRSALRRSLLAEAGGTYLLVLVGTGAVAMNVVTGGLLGPLGVGLVFGAVVAVVILAIGPVSGAHINPAVTFAAWLDRRISGPHAVAFAAAQAAGAVAASLTLAVCVGRGADLLGTTVPACPDAAAFGLEAAMTALMVFAAGTMERSGRGARWCALAVGAAVVFDAFLGGRYTGASMNPARSLGPALVAGVWTAHWLYWAGPMVGAVAGARLARAARP